MIKFHHKRKREQSFYYIVLNFFSAKRRLAFAEINQTKGMLHCPDSKGEQMTLFIPKHENERAVILQENNESTSYQTLFLTEQFDKP